MGKMLNILDEIDKIIINIIKVIAITLFLGLMILITANIIVRRAQLISLHWFDEILELMVVAMVFYGSAAVWMHKEHFSVGNWIGKRIKNPGMAHLYRMILEIIGFIFIAIFFYYSLQLTIHVLDVSNIFRIPKKIFYSCMPISSAIMALYSIRHIVEEFINVIHPKPVEETK
jgi:TRAP-type transport system small permease protein